MGTRNVGVPGGSIFVVDEGSGSPLVLLHAGIADHRSWDAVVVLLDAAGYRTIRYDQRGTGAGRTTTEDIEFSRVDDLIAVLDASGVRQAALIGNSMGGQLAFDTAITAPERVVAIVGVAAGLGGFPGEETPEETAIFKEMEEIEGQDPVDPAAVAEIDIRAWVDGPGQPPTRVAPWIRDLVREMDVWDPSQPQGKPNRLDPPANERIREIRCPVLAVAGELDFGEVAQVARHLEANAPNARALIWPDVAHMIGMEQPERLSAAIVDFLAPLDRWD
jgi:pimeloyl-ACP methyl ester carboxylesterase